MKTKVKKENKKEKKAEPVTCKRCEIKRQIDRLSKLFDAVCVLIDDIEKAEKGEARESMIKCCDKMLMHFEDNVGILHTMAIMLPIPR